MQALSRRSRLRTISVSIRRNWGLLLLLLPAVVFAAIFMYRPMVGILIAFKDYKPAKGILGSPWTSQHGFKYFLMFFDTYNCWTVIWNTVAVSLYMLIAGFPIPIIFALLLNQMQHAHFKKVVQTVTYAPHFISMVVLIGIMRIMFAPSSGLVNLALSALGFNKVMFLTDASWFRHLYVWSGVWQNTGWDSIIYIAALANVSPELHEAATVDGASKLQRILYVDFPSILPSVALEGRPVLEQTMRMAQRSQRMILDMVDGSALHQVVCWTPDSPKLYDVQIEMDSGDAISTYFGMRKIHVADGRVLLNNKPIYQRLVLDQGYWPDSLITPPSDEAIKADIEWTLQLGYNGARKHQKLEDPRYYYWADKLGLLVWEELPSAYEYTAEVVANTSETLTGGIERDFNHPSVITWVPVNESWGMDRLYANKQMQASANMLYYQVKALDGTRIVSTNDGWECVQSDIFGLHDYAATGDVLAKHFASRSEITEHACDHRMAYCDGKEWNGREAFLLTEYGGIAFEDKSSGSWGYHDKVADEESFFQRYKSLTDAARAIPYCQGYVYTQLTDVQQEQNGILTPDRKPKVDVERFRRLTINPDGRYQ